MRERISRFLNGQIATSIIYILLGLCLILMPIKAVYVICKVIFGIVMIAAGLYHLYIYLREKPNATLLDLFSGAILLVVGGFLFFNPQIVVKIFPILLGAFILIDSVWTLQGAIRLRRQGNDTWRFLLGGSLIFIALGITLIINPFTVVKYTIIFAGWILLCNGIIDLVFMMLIRRGIKAVAEASEIIQPDAAAVQDAEVIEEAPAEEDTAVVQDSPDEKADAEQEEEQKEAEEEPLQEWKD